jgi:glycerol-3-phosphate acyltransferase PlsX
MITIAVDAMGGDRAPGVEVEGAVLAAREYGVGVILVGDQNAVKAELRKHAADGLAIEIVHASEVILMTDSASKALRSKRDSSIRVANRLVAEGRAQGVVSAGNTGAAMVTSKVVLGVIPGVDRPALAQVFPTLKEQWAVLIDVGANVDCSPEMLAQFAVMGSVYSRVICHCENPRVGILSIGEEEHKGNDLTREATPLLKQLPINFIGNVEGRDLYSGLADVIVCDGFIGNVALKVSEGLVQTITTMLKQSLEATLTRKIGYVLSREAFEDFRKRVDYSEYGGAPMLGVKGVCIICHGNSNAKAIKNAIRVTAETYRGGVNRKIEASLVQGLDNLKTAGSLG